MPIKEGILSNIGTVIKDKASQIKETEKLRDQVEATILAGLKDLKTNLQPNGHGILFIYKEGTTPQEEPELISDIKISAVRVGTVPYRIYKQDELFNNKKENAMDNYTKEYSSAESKEILKQLCEANKDFIDALKVKDSIPDSEVESYYLKVKKVASQIFNNPANLEFSFSVIYFAYSNDTAFSAKQKYFFKLLAQTAKLSQEQENLKNQLIEVSKQSNIGINSFYTTDKINPEVISNLEKKFSVIGLVSEEVHKKCEKAINSLFRYAFLYNVDPNSLNNNKDNSINSPDKAKETKINTPTGNEGESPNETIGSSNTN